MIWNKPQDLMPDPGELVIAIHRDWDDEIRIGIWRNDPEPEDQDIKQAISRVLVTPPKIIAWTRIEIPEWIK